MQGLKSLFSRPLPSTPKAAPVKQPVVLDHASLKLVAGGLPRVSSPAVVFEDPALPRVS